MSHLEEIEIRIRPDGKVEVQVSGVKGKGCESLTEALEKGLGGEILDRRHTDEYYQEGEEESEEENRLGQS